MKRGQPQYKGLKLKDDKEFQEWLSKTATRKITFEGNRQDFTTWWIDDRGEVLHSDLQSSVWDSSMLIPELVVKGEYPMFFGGSQLIHRVLEIEELKPRK